MMSGRHQATPQVAATASHLPVEENPEKQLKLLNLHTQRCISWAEVGTIGGEEDGVIGDGELAPIEDAKAMVVLVSTLQQVSVTSTVLTQKTGADSTLTTCKIRWEAVPNFPIVLHGGSGIPDDQTSYQAWCC